MLTSSGAHQTLWLEPLNLRHAAALAHQYRDPATAQRCGLPMMKTPADAPQWIAQRHREGPINRAWMHRSLGLVGYGELHLREDTTSLCLWIGVDFRGRGFGTALVHALCEVAWANGMRRVLSAVFEDNTPSRRALRSAGFVAFAADDGRFGTRRHHLIRSLAPVTPEEALCHLADFCERRPRAQAT